MINYRLHPPDTEAPSRKPCQNQNSRAVDTTESRLIVAYNAGYDSAVIRAECARYGLDVGHLGDRHRWHCLMTQRSAHLGVDRSLPLGGQHRALADCRAALGLLRSIAEPERGDPPAGPRWAME